MSLLELAEMGTDTDLQLEIISVCCPGFSALHRNPNTFRDPQAQLVRSSRNIADADSPGGHQNL